MNPELLSSAVWLKDYAPPPFLIDRAELAFDLDAETTQVEAILEMRRNPMAREESRDLRLDGEGLELEFIALDRHPLPPEAYRRDDSGLLLYQVPERFRLHTRVRIHPRRNTALEGLYVSEDMLCTQCEAEGFRRLTYCLDRPDVMTRFSVTLTADRARYPVLLSNGNPAGTEILPGGRHRARWEDPFPKPSYLFALVAGDLRALSATFRTVSGREVALHVYVEPENLDQGDHALQALRQAMRWDEERYGREYDLEIYNMVAVSHFNMGAMENKGLNLFNARYVLARADTATDQDFQGIESVVAHEYFHNWTGNRITCRDWFQLSLKEGFTVFRDQEFSADRGACAVQRIADVRALRTHQFAEDAGPLAHPVRPESYLEINNFYTATVYEKGAEVVRMQATLLGPERFRQATDLYFARHDGQAVTTDDFVACMEEAGGRDLTRFKRWYSQAGTPRLEVSGHHDPQTGCYRLRTRQWTPPTPGQPHKLPLHFPLALGLLDARGADLPVQLADEKTPPPPGTRILEIRDETHEFCFIGLPERPVPSLLRGFSAPVQLHFDYTEAERRFLMAKDRDGFTRWEAAQTLSQQRLLELVQDHAQAIPEDYLDAFCQTLTDESAAPALRAEILALPAESYLGEQLEVVDVEGIHRARETLKTGIAWRLRSELQVVYARHSEGDEPYAPTPEAIGRRALKNRCLEYLMQIPDEPGLALCQAQFAAARNMTDQLAALRLLVDTGGASGRDALARFHDQWRHQRLVIDKWFAIQAAAKPADTLERVRRLLTHPAYADTDPNRVRSLVGTFCLANPVRFHTPGGAGYRLLREQVLRLDPLNPQLAARLLQGLVRWRRFDAERQARMRGELEDILATPGLSRGCCELASKALAED